MVRNITVSEEQNGAGGWVLAPGARCGEGSGLRTDGTRLLRVHFTRHRQRVLGASPHKRKGLVVPAACAPAWGGMLIRGCGMDGIPALAPIPPTVPTAMPGAMRPMGAIPARGTMATGCAGIEESAVGSMTAKPEGMGLTRIWFRVGGAGWLTWKGLAWAAGGGAEPPEQTRWRKRGDEREAHEHSCVITVLWSLHMKPR